MATDSCEVAAESPPEMRTSMNDRGQEPPPPSPDFPEGGESSPHLCALVRPVVRASSTGEEKVEAVGLGVAAGPGIGVGVGLVEGAAPGR